MAKTRIIIVLVLFSLLNLAGAVRPPAISDVYLSQVGVMEKPLGSNWGTAVQGYLRSTNMKVPAPWCAAFVRWCLDSAGIKTTITAYSPTAQNKKNLVYYQHTWLKEMREGDVFTIYFPAMKRIAHTGFVHKRVNDTVVETVEGNSNDGGSREGVGVFKRKRSAHTLWSISRWQ